MLGRCPFIFLAFGRLRPYPLIFLALGALSVRASPVPSCRTGETLQCSLHSLSMVTLSPPSPLAYVVLSHTFKFWLFQWLSKLFMSPILYHLNCKVETVVPILQHEMKIYVKSISTVLTYRTHSKWASFLSLVPLLSIFTCQYPTHTHTKKD